MKMEWNSLKEHASELADTHLSRLFDEDPSRFERLHYRAGPLLLDLSKQRMTADTLDKLVALAEASDLREWTRRFFDGEEVNGTEARAAMHWALRAPPGSAFVSPEVDRAVQEQLARMERIVNQLHSGQWRGYSGEPITDVVNIGVGGSDLGPLMVSRALEDFSSPCTGIMNVHFVSSMDGSQVSHLLRQLRPQTTLFIISSKSFTTVDTLYNANTARKWMQTALGGDPAVVRCHFLAVSSAQDKVAEWGIDEDNRLSLWDWVGGRYSVWSSIGLPVAIRIGMSQFREFLAGGHFMDRHFVEADWKVNLPVLMAMTGVWNTDVLGIHGHAILPYDGRLKYLPSYLEQLEMESNGKSVTRDGEPVSERTCPILWGDVGPNAQHAFYQLLHQGTEPVTCDFIAPARRYHEDVHSSNAQELVRQHELALANCLAQSRLLALGEAALPSGEQVPFYKRYRGNQPCTTLMMEELTPFSLGALLAAYEHKVFTQAVIWRINPFDQWGVEMGKKIATSTLQAIRAGDDQGMDVSTSGLLSFIRNR
ncbi:glucose-6-phosphate isomerase [Alloalcanivorax xenomutans]|uniref:glucose-6-phosphate isomerase n=1 Tax=Alloalcanivorax xenomutans TaxID=1094342 RepID=UPI00244C6A9B|nr:glucose-6-phosphate isomerase [Alloalcanivorax xenomutans]